MPCACWLCPNFYPRPPRGGRPHSEALTWSGYDFYPRPPRGGRPGRPRNGHDRGHFYPRPPRGGRQGFCVHVLAHGDFYPRPPRGGRPASPDRGENITQFLSTPSARRATDEDWEDYEIIEDFYPRPPRGGRPDLYRLHPESHMISIHALREEGDRAGSVRGMAVNLFLSTPSARRATAKTETKSLFSNKLYNILHEFRRALIYSGSKNYPNHAKRLKNLVRRCRKDAENSPFAPGRETQNNSRPSCSKGG